MPEVELTLNAPVNTSGNTGATIPASILVIDDEASIRESLEVLLSLEGYTIAMAVDGEEGLRMLESNSYDLVLLDLAMPGQSGLEILPQIKERQPDLPVIMITAYKEGSHIKRAVELGVRKTFLKGDFDLEELGNYVDSLAPGGPASDQPGQPFHCN